MPRPRLGSASHSDHHGLHTYFRHALAGGRTLVEVKSAAGHASPLTTNVYLHVVVDEREEVGELFAASRPRAQLKQVCIRGGRFWASAAVTVDLLRRTGGFREIRRATFDQEHLSL